MSRTKDIFLEIRESQLLSEQDQISESEFDQIHESNDRD